MIKITIKMYTALFGLCTMSKAVLIGTSDGESIGLYMLGFMFLLCSYLMWNKEEPKPKPHICKYCGSETTQPDNECYANNPPPQETL